MKVAERTELAKWVRLKCKAAKNDASASMAERLAYFESQIAAIYDPYDQEWAGLAEEADAKIKQLDAELAERCKALGIPPTMRPVLAVSWRGRGENASKERRAELRRVAEARVEASVLRAHAQIDRNEVELIGKIVQDALDTEGAKAFFDAMPSIEQLIPQLSLKEVEARTESNLGKRNRYLLGD